MVHQTFFRLPAEKQMRILQSAAKEFINLPYEKTSINRIIAKAGIPKGSFYQYFDGKEDLYMLCIREVYRQILAARQANSESLLDTGLGRASRIGLRHTSLLYTEEIRRIVGEDSFRLLQSLIQAPRQIRNAALLEISVELVMPAVREELSRDASIRPDADLDYYAYLLSIGEMLAIDYASRSSLPPEELWTLSYEYLDTVLQKIKRP